MALGTREQDTEVRSNSPRRLCWYCSRLSSRVEFPGDFAMGPEVGVTQGNVLRTALRGQAYRWGVGDGTSACLLPPLSPKSREPRAELVGALPSHWPSWCTSGVVVHTLWPCRVESQELCRYTTTPRRLRALGPAQGFGGGNPLLRDGLGGRALSLQPSLV
jgi:hypothetical protein